MQISIHVPNFKVPGGDADLGRVLGESAAIAEEAGCAWFTLMDHWFQMEQLGGAPEPMLEGYTSLGYVAARTRRIQLGLLVTGVTYRHPGLLAKIVTTLDVLSGGRAMLGIGAAWYEEEHAGLGVPFPPVAERFERLEETLRICLQMWSDDDGPFEGTHYRLARTVCSPRPLQSPRPPILIGGGGEKKTLRLVARYADACNLFAAGTEAVAHKLDVLAAHCADAGRDPAEIKKTLLSQCDPSAPDDFLREMESYAKLGIDHVAVMPGNDPVGYATELGEKVIPRLSQI
ncbi:LLM class F420-dependent oxidoreductase [Allonocardiopsis opalescens]|uniref:F420-dependent oxidoreductase-like protein n=1 Tax=Allonocardiopsis opalescens TaxID=1144618 RepID=A0A2T0PYY4_9ACTN|nr:LLM class F420-dependent oxidoreductase [Allonocardiopsis opalescens]PRX96753.1 F420-dependent oxidoreductase-like protein [Allonocardiopsis opalescens]